MCSYIEAEASVLALKDSHQPVVGHKSSVASEAHVDPDSGVRLPPQSSHQLQQLVVTAIVTGMKLAHSCQHFWAVVNGGVYAWNAFLPIFRTGRCAASMLGFFFSLWHHS
jgi:hypothetical protein